MRKRLNEIANKLFDIAEDLDRKWYHPFRFVAIVVCLGIMFVSELVTGKPFFYPALRDKKKKNEDE